MPTPRPPAGRGRVHGMQLPSPVRLLPPRRSAGHRSRHSQHLHPLPPPQPATVPESRQPSTRESCAQATALHSRTRWQGVVQLLRGKCTPALNRSSPPASDLYRCACTGSSRRSATGGSSPARTFSSSAISCDRSARTAQAQPDLPRMSTNNGPALGFGSRVPRIRPALSNRNRVCRCRFGVLTGQFVSGTVSSRCLSQTESPLPAWRNQRAVTVALQPDYLPNSTDRSRSRIWIVSDRVSTSLQPSQSIQIYSAQT